MWACIPHNVRLPLLIVGVAPTLCAHQRRTLCGLHSHIVRLWCAHIVDHIHTMCGALAHNVWPEFQNVDVRAHIVWPEFQNLGVYTNN